MLLLFHIPVVLAKHSMSNSFENEEASFTSMFLLLLNFHS